MEGTSYAALREENLKEKLLKLKEIGVDPSKSRQQTSKKRIRKNSSSNDDDDWAASKRPVKRRGRNPAPTYDGSSNDPDFDPDDPGKSESSKDSQDSSSVSRGRPRKTKTVKTYSEFIDVDINLFCVECALYHEGDCPVHGPLIVVKDTPVPCNSKDKTRAIKTAPLEVRVADCKTQGGRNRVWAKNFIPARILFGPYEGHVVSKNFAGGSYIWEIKRNGNVLHCIDATDPAVCNWLRYIAFAPNDGEQNMNAYQYKGEIYYRTIKDIEAHEELLVWKGDAYGCLSGEDRRNRIKTNDSKGDGTISKSYKCPGCSIAFVSQDYVDRHVKSCRKLRNDCAEVVYKCTGCLCAYSSLDYLERHRKVCRKIEPTVTTVTMFKCSGCKCAYATQDYLERHKKICKELGMKKYPREVFPCPGCKCAYSSRDYLDRHKRVCRQLEPQKLLEVMHKCTACQTAYADPKYLERHKKTCRQIEWAKRADIQTKYECSACHSVYTDKMFLERHQKVCEGARTCRSDKPSFECPGCHSVYGNLEFLNRHKINCAALNSSKRSELKCSTCPSSFPDQTLLNRHKMSCGKLVQSLQDALREEEEERRIFENDSDGDVKKIPTNVRKTENVKSSPCDEIKKEPPFVLLERVAWFDPLFHERTRLNGFFAKPLNCPDCNEPFSYKARLNQHRLVHLKQTLNVCLECDKVFCNKKLYADHMESHG